MVMAVAVARAAMAVAVAMAAAAVDRLVAVVAREEEMAAKVVGGMKEALVKGALEAAM